MGLSGFLRAGFVSQKDKRGCQLQKLLMIVEVPVVKCMLCRVLYCKVRMVLFLFFFLILLSV